MSKNENYISEENLIKKLDKEIDKRKMLIKMEMLKDVDDNCYSLVSMLSCEIRCIERLKKDFEFDFRFLKSNIVDDLEE